MHSSAHDVIRITNQLALTLIAVIALVLPAAYFTLSHEYIRGNMDAEGALCSREIHELVIKNPTLWQFEEIRIQGLLQEHKPDVPQTYRVRDRQENLVIEVVQSVTQPMIVQRYNLYDAGNVTGTLEISRSLFPPLMNTLWVFTGCLLLGALTLLGLRTFPLRAIRQAHQSLEESEERYRRLFESVSDAVFVVNPDTGRIVEVNDTAVTLYGYSRSDLLQRQFADLSAARDDEHQDNQDHHGNADRREGSAEGPIQFHRKNDGTVFPIEVSPRSFTWRDQTVQIFAVRDVTDRIRLEEEQKKFREILSRKEKMEAVGLLSGGIAHDFNNLLMGIQGYASLMMMDINENNPHYEMLRAIENQVQSGANLTRQLLGFAQGGRYHVKTTDLNELIKQTADMFGRTRKEILIHEDYVEDIWGVDVDRSQMEQVLLNLFLNAWQAMPTGGDLSLATDNVRLDAAYVAPYECQVGSYVKVSITDTGEGMDENTRKRIFDPFFTTRQRGRGTGLGLASAYGIIKGHGGFITVHTEISRGTSFHVYLPASQGKVIAAEQTPAALVSGQETILVVDDEEIILDTTRRMLEGLGYHVYMARDGLEAMEVFRANLEKIDLVILDMIMPGMGGGEIFERLRSLKADVRVILASGYSLNEQAQEIMMKGVCAFLQKPYLIDELSQKIRDALGK